MRSLAEKGTVTVDAAAGARPPEQAIRKVVQDWALYRDAGVWDRFREVWHEDGWMTATWFQGSAEDFIAATRESFESGVRIMHLLSQTAIDVVGGRAIAQTRMTISQRASVDGVEVDVECFGRFYDFFELRADWRIVRRQPIYEKDRLTVLDPEAELSLDRDLLARYPEGYRYLGYVQEKAGMEVEQGLPGLTGPEVEALYALGDGWLRGEPAFGPAGATKSSKEGEA